MSTANKPVTNPVHNLGGFLFDRCPSSTAHKDGSVRIRFRVCSQEPNTEYGMIVDPDSWASLIAGLSVRGETSETWELARQLHNRPSVCFTIGTE